MDIKRIRKSKTQKHTKSALAVKVSRPQKSSILARYKAVILTFLTKVRLQSGKLTRKYIPKNLRVSLWGTKQRKAITSGVTFCLIAAVILINVAHASDLLDNWTFSNSGDYTYDNSTTEVAGNSVRLKAQEYSTDANTAALYHLNETTGTSAADSSGNSNTGTTQNSPSWGSGRLNNGLNLNGSSQYLTTPNASSLQLTQKNTLEAQMKLNSNFASGSSDDQTLIDKSSYKLVLDKTTGKLTYVLNSNSYSWTDRYGSELPTASGEVRSMQAIGSDLYVTISIPTSTPHPLFQLYKWNGSSWTMLGAQMPGYGFLFTDGTNLFSVSGTLTPFAGTNLYSDVIFYCVVATGCSSWVQKGQIVSAFSNTTSLPLPYNNKPVAVVGTKAYIAGNIGVIYDCDISGSTTCASRTVAANYDVTDAIVSDGTNLYVGMGYSAQDADVYYCTVASWACTQVAGTNTGGTGTTKTNTTNWGSGYEQIGSMSYAGGNLYVGLGLGANDDEVWVCTASCSTAGSATWSQIGGDNLNSGWSGQTSVIGLVSDGTNIYAVTSIYGSVWKWNGTAWSRIRDLSSYTTSASSTRLYYGNSTLYEGIFDSHSSELSTVNTTSGAATLIGGHNKFGSWDGGAYQGTQFFTKWHGDMYAAVPGYAASDGSYYENSIFKISNCSTTCTWTRVGGSYVNNGLGEVTSFYGLFTYNDKVCTIVDKSSSREIWCYDGSNWARIATHADLGSNAAKKYVTQIFNGNLYIAESLAVTSQLVKVYNGSSWSTSMSSLSNDYGASLSVLDGKLYFLVGGGGFATGGYYSFDGTTWSGRSSLTTPATIDVSFSIAVGDKIYYRCSQSAMCSLDKNGTNVTVSSNIGNGGDLASYELNRSARAVYFGNSIYIADGNYNTGANQSSGSLTQYDLAADSTVTVLPSEYSTFTGAYTPALYANSYQMMVGDLDRLNPTLMNLWTYDNPYVQSSTSSWTAGTWYHVAGTYDGENMKLYVNGTEQASSGITKTLSLNSLPLYIGRNYGSTGGSTGLGYLSGVLDEVRISNSARTSFNINPYVSSAQIVSINSAIRLSGVVSWDAFTTNETTNGGSINYQLSDDNGVTWKYFTAGAWQAAASTANANTAAVVNTNISSFPVTFAGLKWRAVLQGDGTQQVTLSSVSVASTSDVTAPSANASSITAKKVAGGANLAAGDWTNGSTPYFSWNAGADASSGIKGYCLYLGSDSSGDPVTTKGLLGTSPNTTGGHCQFLVTGTILDTSQSGYLASALTTSNSSYYLNVKAIDNAGNAYPTNAQFAFKFDNTPPSNPAYISGPSSFINNKSATFTWPTGDSNAASDANSGVAGLQYKINSANWFGDLHLGTQDMTDMLTDDGSYATSATYDYANIVDGINVIQFRTWDQAGNTSSSTVSAELKVNTTGAPSTPQNLTAVPSSNTTNSFAFNWNAPGSFVGSASNLTYCYTVNAVPTAQNCTFTDPGVTSVAAGAYATQPGNNTFYVVAKDESSNINYGTYASVVFNATTSAPGFPLNVGIADVSIRATSTWKLAVTWEAPTNPGIGVSTYKIYRSTNGSTFTLIASSASTNYVDTNLSQIAYYYKIKACDSTNNCSADSDTVSKTPTGRYTSPANMVSEKPTVTNISTRKATVSWVTDRDSDSRIQLGTKSGQYSPNEVTVADQVTNHKIDLDNLSAGTVYYAKVKWTDVDGNVGVSGEFSFVTLGAPTVGEVSVSGVNLSSANILFNSKNATQVKVYYGKSDSFGAVKVLNTSQSASAYTVVLDGLDDGTKYFYKVNPVDVDGFEYNSNVYTFSTPTRPHITDLTFQPIEGEPTSTQKVNWKTNVPASSQVSYFIKGQKPTEVVESTLVTEHEVIIRGLADNSEYTLVASSRDGNGNVATSDAQVFRTALDTRPPKITDVTVESTIKGVGSEARGQIIVSWKTDEPATSQIAFGEGTTSSGFGSRSTEDSGLTTEHVVVVSDLSTSKVYSLQILSKDRAGNVGKSEPQTTIIGRASDSVLTVIVNTLSKLFSWLGQ